VSDTPRKDGPLSASALGRIDEACDRFEDAWQAGERPRLEEYLEGAEGPEREARLRGLLRLELLYRRQRGEAPTQQEYRQRFPDVGPLLDQLFPALKPGVPLPPPPEGLTSAPGPHVTTTYHPLPPAGGAGPPSLPGYEVLGELGRGAMGVVYKARHISLQREVALKMILAGNYARDQDRARFLAEARAIARLQHPNIVAVHEIGEHEGRPFFSLEFCPGGGLDRKLAGTPQPPRDAARLVEVLARAVETAHQAGIVHRDLKPANVLIARDGAPKVTDFGLAKRLEEQGLTGTGVAVGTPSYMAPEQAQGKSREVGPAADVWALGAILYECLTGRPPFRAANALDTLLQVVGDAPVPVRRLQPAVPRDLEAICLKCLHKAPGHRYSSAADLGDDLERFLAGEPIGARPVGAAERALKWVKRRPAVAGLLAAVLLLVLVGGALAWRWQQQSVEARARQREVGQKAQLALERGRALLQDGWQAHDQAKLMQAKAEADRAADIATGADEEARRQVVAFQEEVAQRLARAEKNHALMVALLDISGPAETRSFERKGTGQLAPLAEQSANEQYARAFQRWGLDVDRASEADALARLRQEPAVVVQEVLTGLDGWLLERRRRRQPEPEWRRLQRLADRLDEDQSSRQLRALLCEEEATAARGLAGLMGALAGPVAPWGALAEQGRDYRWRLAGLAARANEGRKPVRTVVLLARASQEAGDAAGAEAVLRQALARRPNQVVLLAALSRLLEAQGPDRLGEAIECYRAARALRPKLGLALARALSKAGRAAEGEAVMRDLLLQQPNHPELHFYLGFALYNQKKLDEAVKAFRKALEIQPEATTYNNLGLALANQKKLGEAVKAYRKAIDLKHKYAVAHYNLGNALYDQKQLAEAVRAYRKAIDLQPKFALASTNLDNALLDLEKEDEAGKAVPKAKIPPDLEGPDRRAAEWVLSIGGNIHILVNNQGRSLGGADTKLPNERFQLTQVDLYLNQKVTDVGLACFRGCKNVTALNLGHARVTGAGLAHFKECKELKELRLVGGTAGIDAGLANFKDCKNLTVLDLNGTGVTDAGLAYFKRCKNLTVLNLFADPVTDKGLAHFKDCKELKELILGRTAVTDTGLAYFKGCKNLTVLNLEFMPGISDAGLAHFKDCKGLTYLNVYCHLNSRVGDAGLANFKGCKALTFLRLDGTAVTDTGLAHFKDCKGLTYLNLGLTAVTDTGLAYFKDCKGLTTLYLGGKNVTDAGLAHFKDCKGLAELYLGETQLSDAGLAHLKNCKGLKILHLDNTQVSDAGLAHLKDCKNLTLLDLRKTKATAAKIDELKAALPKCKIEWDGGVIEPMTSPDRKAAEYVLSIGGNVHILVDNQDRSLGGADTKLPNERFLLTHVNLAGAQKVTDVGLACFRGCKNLTALNLYGTGPLVTDKGLAHFKGCKELKELVLGRTAVTDAGLAYFKGCKNLTILNLEFMPGISDAGLAHFKDCKGLTHLNLYCHHNWRVGDAGLANFKDCKALTFLRLDGTAATDTGLAYFKDCKGLTILVLGGKNVTDAGLAHFKDCKGLTELYLVETPLSDAGLAHLKDFKGLKILHLIDTKVGDAGLAHLKGLANLRTLSLVRSQVTGPGLGHLKGLPLQSLDLSGAKVSDAGLASLKGLTNLRDLNLIGTGVTDTGLAHLKGLARLENLHLTGLKVTNAGLAYLKGLANLQNLNLSYTGVTDAGLAHLKDCKELRALNLNNTQGSDAGLAHLKGLTSLTYLDLRKTKATAAKIDELKAALPKCKIEWDGGVIEPRTSLDRKAAEYVLTIGGAVRVNDQDRDLKAVADLPPGPFRLTGVGLGWSKVEETGLALFSACKGLTSLNLAHTKVGDAGWPTLRLGGKRPGEVRPGTRDRALCSRLLLAALSRAHEDGMGLVSEHDRLAGDRAGREDRDDD
jgi:tetratricopeptide (TPR) repeat protein/Leucine-rich repeat (LRR) protein/tRNA A-37 threonylcarbamoyl transferase component Bud32